MSELKPIRIGDRVTKFPAQTHNALIAGEQQRRNQLEKIDDLRGPKQKSPVVVRVVCPGLNGTAPGHVVRINGVAEEPATAAWSPYEGLVFTASSWSAAGQKWDAYAILLDHVTNGNELVSAVLPGCYWAKLSVADSDHTHAVRPDAGGTLLLSANYGQRIVWKESGTGEKWAIVRLQDSDVRCQLGVVKEIPFPGAATYDATVDANFEIQGGSIVTLYLLTSHSGALVGQEVEDTGLVTALDMRRDGQAKVGDVVRVWSATGHPVLPGTGSASDTFCDVLNVGDYLRGLSTYSAGDDQVLTHLAGSPALVWTTFDDVVSGGGGGGSGTLTTINEGYAIDVSGSAPAVTVAFDPTEITGYSTTVFQVFAHEPTADGGPSPKWWTINGYDETKQQSVLQTGGAIDFDDAHKVRSTVDDTTSAFLHAAFKNIAAAGTYVATKDAYITFETDGAAGTNQTERAFLDVSDISGYSAGVVQLLGKDANNVFCFKTISAWLSLLTDYVGANDQSIGHDADDIPTWQNDGTCT